MCFWPCLEKGDGLTALPKHSSVIILRENTKSKNRGPLKLTFKTTETTGYSERTVRRDVAEKSEISGATFTSPAKRHKIDRKLTG